MRTGDLIIIQKGSIWNYNSNARHGGFCNIPDKTAGMILEVGVAQQYLKVLLQDGRTGFLIGGCYTLLNQEIHT